MRSLQSRGQAAGEFVTTYGWSILLLLVALGVLFSLGVFNPGSGTPQGCMLPPGFSCYDMYLDGSGNLFLEVGQATGKDVFITGLGCGGEPGADSLPTEVFLKSGEHAVVSAGGVHCAGASSGSYSGRIAISYRPADSQIEKIVTGTLTAPVSGAVEGFGAGAFPSEYRLGYFRPVTINTGVASNLTDFPAYFIMDTQSLISAGKMNSSCKDLRVVDYTLAGVMDYEIEANTCNKTNTVVWFRIPQTNANNPYTAYAYYGNDSAPDAQNKAGVWSNNFLAVFHLGLDALDSSPYANNGVNYRAVNASGKFGNGTEFNGNDTVIIANSAAADELNPQYNISVSAWVYGRYPKNSNYVITRGWGDSYELASQSSGVVNFRIVHNATSSINVVSPHTIANQTWQHVAGVYDGASVRVYINGEPENSAPFSLSMYQTGHAVGIGAIHHMTTGYYGNGFNGTIDEARIAHANRSNDWIKAEYGQTYSVGSEQGN